MRVLAHLEPAEVFRYFEEIAQIPHGSGNTRLISDYLVRFAKERRLEVIQDASGNVVIRKDGTEGYEDSGTVMLQGHMDMICEKEPWCTRTRRAGSEGGGRDRLGRGNDTRRR